jgi:hypothetical protein
MNRITLSAVVVLFLLGSLTYAVKQKVADLDHRLAQIEAEIIQYQESLHVLNAEWAYLTRPERLQALVESKTSLHQVQGVELVSYKEFNGTKEPLIYLVKAAR